MEKTLLISQLKVIEAETTEATGDLIGNKIANRITKVLKNSQKNNSERVTDERDKKIPKGKYVSPEEIQEIIDELRLKQYNNGISKNHKSFTKNSQQYNSKTVTND